MSGANEEANEPVHYGTKPGDFETSKIHFPTSERTSEWPSTYVSILVGFRPQWSGPVHTFFVVLNHSVVQAPWFEADTMTLVALYREIKLRGSTRNRDNRDNLPIFAFILQ